MALICDDWNGQQDNKKNTSQIIAIIKHCNVNVYDLQITLNWNVIRHNHQLLTGIKLAEQ